MTITPLSLQTGPVEVSQQRPTINDLIVDINAALAEVDAAIAPVTASGIVLSSSDSDATLFADLAIGTVASALTGTVVTDDGWLKVAIDGTTRYIGLGSTFA